VGEQYSITKLPMTAIALPMCIDLTYPNASMNWLPKKLVKAAPAKSIDVAMNQ